MLYDVAIVGGGPGGLAAALTLGRARKRVVVFDGGPRRNEAATHVHNFVTRDGTPPDELRRIAREQLARYAVTLRDHCVDEITGENGAFELVAGGDRSGARKILLCTGMIDEPPDIPGARALWGIAIFSCPYCHGWEVQDRPFGYLARDADDLAYAVRLRGWTSEVTVFTRGRFVVPDEHRALLASASVRLEERELVRLVADGEHLREVELVGGDRVRIEVVFAHPVQHAPEVVRRLELATKHGCVTIDDDERETSRPGIYAAGDLVTPVQSVVAAAATAVHAASMIDHALMMERAASGALR